MAVDAASIAPQRAPDLSLLVATAGIAAARMKVIPFSVSTCDTGLVESG